MIVIRYLFATALLTLLAVRLLAQTTPAPHTIAVRAWSTGQSVKLRWAPSTPYAWRQGNTTGYRLVRYTVLRDGKLVPTEEARRGVPLTATSIRPRTGEAFWGPLMDRDSFAAVAAQALFGDSFDPSVSGTAEPTFFDKLFESENRFGFALFAADHSWETALAMGLAYEDRGIRRNESYLYRVLPGGSGPAPVDSGYVAANPSEVVLLPKPIDINARFGNREVYLTWNEEIFRNFYVSYNIERSEDGANWTRCNQAPFVNLEKEGEETTDIVFKDTLPANNRVYYYRVVGHTWFGETGPPSDPIQGMGQDPLPSYFPEIISVTAARPTGLDVTWDFDPNFEAYITGFHVQRADHYEGPFTTITGQQPLPTAERVYTDRSAEGIHYYRVVAVDRHRREMPSFAVPGEVTDSVPPATPRNIRGRILPDGTLAVTWDDNTERDLRGYRVFFANRRTDDFVQITRDIIRRPYFLDTVSLNTLSEQLFVRVAAVDLHYNTSPLSEPMAVNRPDTVPPSPPVIADLRGGDRVYLRIANCSSLDLDVQLVLRRPSDAPVTAPWDTVATRRGPTDEPYTEVLDSTGKPGRRYHYKAVAFDDAGLRAESMTLEGVRIDNGVRPAVTDLAATPDRTEHLVLLTWKYTGRTGIKKFTIYRGVAGAEPTTHEQIEPVVVEETGRKSRAYVFAYADKNMRMNTRYTYRVRAHFDDGAISPLSAPIEVEY